MSSYKLYCKKVMGSLDDMYLYLYHLPTGQKQPILHSLKIKIPNKYLIYNSGSKNSFKRISKEITKEVLLKNGFDSVSKLNSYLQEKLEDFIKVDGIKEYVDKNNKTLNEWFDILIGGMYNQGTILRYRNVKNLLELFQEQRRNGNKIIYLKDIDKNFILHFQKWLMTEPNENENRQMNTLNSTTYKLKCLKSVINKCNTSKFFSFVENPFNFIEFKELKKPYDVLTLEELQKIMTTELVEVYRRKVPTKDGVDLWGKEIKGGVDLRNEKNKRYKSKHSLDDIRNYFLFQVFSQGIRVSDLITLRWEHFKEIENDDLRIIKVMVKTREIIRIIVNYNMTSIIGKYLERYSFYFTDELEKLERENRNIERQQKHILDDINHFVPKDRLWWDYIPTEFKEILQSNQGETKVSNTLRKGFYINKSILNIVSEKLGNIDEYDFQNQGNLNKIHDRILKYRQQKEETNNQDIKDDCDIELRRIELFIKKFFLKLLVDEYNYFSDSILKTREKRLNEFSENKHKIICNMIKIVSNNKETKNEFVFPLLQNKDFTNVFSDDFSRINEDQYRKFQSVRTYYNGLLKIVGSQCNITKRLSSHTSRHTFTSLMIHLIENVSPYDLMNSLGHKNLSTTQLYMRRFNDKNVDRLNQLFPKSVGYIR